VNKILILFVLVGCCFAADFKKCKLLDIRPYQDNQVIGSNGNVVTVEHDMYAITVAIDGIAVTGEYESRWARSYKPSDLVVGDEIDAKIEGKKLVIKRPDGKELKATIIKRERIR
jgi:hypothetical protein